MAMEPHKRTWSLDNLKLKVMTTNNSACSMLPMEKYKKHLWGQKDQYLLAWSPLPEETERRAPTEAAPPLKLSHSNNNEESYFETKDYKNKHW